MQTARSITMLIDMKISGKRVLVVGGGKVGERKIMTLLREGAEVTVASKRFTERLMSLGKTGKIEVKRIGKNTPSQIKRLLSRSDLAIAATDDEDLNYGLAEKARISKIPICVVDNPEICDFYFPATTDFGNLKIAVSTGGKSPAMAGILRKRLERSVTNEDVLQVELQSYARGLLRSRDVDSSVRKKILYDITKNRKVSSLLRRGRLEEAKKIARGIVKTV